MKYDVTIGIPTFNRAGYLEKAVNSALAQEAVNVEVIVSDNSSVDNTADVMSKYSNHTNVRYLRNTFNIGPSANYNRCLDEARGDHFMILGDDDWLSPDYCKKMIFSINGKDAVFLGQCQTVAPNGEFINRSSDAPFEMQGLEFVEDLLLGKPSVRRHACFMFAARTESIRAAGGFPNTEAGQHCDNMLLTKLLLNRVISYDPVPVNYYSVYPESYGNSNVISIAIASLQYVDYWDKFIEPELVSRFREKLSKKLRKNLIYALAITYITRVVKYGKGWKNKVWLIIKFPRWSWLIYGFLKLLSSKCLVVVR